jgi:energy-coupling factor transporter ATP-binding protein EcfA2
LIYGYDLALYEEFGVKVGINLNPAIHLHTLLTGSSGSGKSYALMYLIGTLLQSLQTVFYICDFKSSKEFSFLRKYKHFYQGEDCYQGILDYHARFNQALKEGGGERHIMVVDEYPSMLSHFETRDRTDKTHQAKDILSAISAILMMGRGVGFGLWIVTQRADSSWFPAGSRDNFMLIICVGRVSREQQHMLFSGEDIPDRVYQPGQGVLLADGEPLREVIFPTIKDLINWKSYIMGLLYKNIGQALTLPSAMDKEK